MDDQQNTTVKILLEELGWWNSLMYLQKVLRSIKEIKTVSSSRVDFIEWSWSKLERSDVNI